MPDVIQMSGKIEALPPELQKLWNYATDLTFQSKQAR
jgi:hypothetical protein